MHGTTGYRFANVVSGLFVDTTARDKMERIYRAFVPDVAPYEDVVYSSKKLILRTALASELNVLANQTRAHSPRRSQYARLHAQHFAPGGDGSARLLSRVPDLYHRPPAGG